MADCVDDDGEIEICSPGSRTRGSAIGALTAAGRGRRSVRLETGAMIDSLSVPLA
jgi:hypothetical protein